MSKPYSASSERNREPILAVLREHFADRQRVLEIGSGTGQHAVHFAAALPQLVWQSADREENLDGIRLWLEDAALPNTPPPLVLDVTQADWPAPAYDAVFSANTLHIMGWDQVREMFRRLPEVMAPGAKLAVYGPFNYGGQFTSQSNADFDRALKQGDPKRGIRDAEAVDELASAVGLKLLQDHAMPTNNRCRVWRLS